jgi:SsrA-binding protein
MPNITTNKQGLHHYQILEKFEAGIVLSGPEVKSVKTGQINLKGSYISIDGQSQAWLVNAHIAPYKPASSLQSNYQPTKNRRLLLHKKDINYLLGKSRQTGLTILPISVYTKGSLIKLEVGLAKGKKKWDKREAIKKRDTDREIRRKLKKF